MLLWQGEEVDEQRAVTDSMALSDGEDARASARASAEGLGEVIILTPRGQIV